MKKRFSLFNGNSLRFGIVAAGSCLCSRVFFKTPIDMLHTVKGINLLPPIWMHNLLSIFCFFLLGAASGGIIEATAHCFNNGDNTVLAYKGGLFCLSAFFISIIRYHVFFLYRMLFASLILSVICLLCSLICAIYWHKIRPKFASAILFFFAFWQFYLMFVCMSAFFYN